MWCYGSLSGRRWIPRSDPLGEVDSWQMRGGSPGKREENKDFKRNHLLESPIPRIPKALKTRFFHLQGGRRSLEIIPFLKAAGLGHFVFSLTFASQGASSTRVAVKKVKLRRPKEKNYEALFVRFG